MSNGNSSGSGCFFIFVIGIVILTYLEFTEPWGMFYSPEPNVESSPQYNIQDENSEPYNPSFKGGSVRTVKRENVYCQNCGCTTYIGTSINGAYSDCSVCGHAYGMH